MNERVLATKDGLVLCGEFRQRFDRLQLVNLTTDMVVLRGARFDAQEAQGPFHQFAARIPSQQAADVSELLTLAPKNTPIRLHLEVLRGEGKVYLEAVLTVSERGGSHSFRLEVHDDTSPDGFTNSPA